MKTFTTLSLLTLLLYHTGRVGLVLLCFDQWYPAATPVMAGDEWVVVKMPISLPYTSTWQNPEQPEGLLRLDNEFYNVTGQHYANDTLYTVMKTNQNARERFFALADELQQQLDKNTTAPTAENPLAHLLKHLNQLANQYLSQGAPAALTARTVRLLAAVPMPAYTARGTAAILPVPVPPPEA